MMSQRTSTANNAVRGASRCINVPLTCGLIDGGHSDR